MLNKYVQEEQAKTMNMIKMKLAFIWAKLVIFFMLYHQVFYTGSRPVKIYVHLAYWVIMIPVLVASFLQIKHGNTQTKTLIILIGLLIRLLFSNFDIEGRFHLLNKDGKVQALSMNFFAGSFLTMFLCMFINKNAFIIIVALIASSVQAAAWELMNYQHIDC